MTLGEHFEDPARSGAARTLPAMPFAGNPILMDF